MKPELKIPRATYRLQLNRDFTFAQATAIVPYLSALGISHCYISPCLKARPGSMHGYDIVDHNSLNPEIGSDEDFDVFVAALHAHEMGLILDIVPNHMGVMGSDNVWWMDVLENGEASAYACFFDIDWHPLKDELQSKVLVPVLHDHYGAVLESGELRLVFRAERGEFDISYRNHRFPVNPRAYPRILQRASGMLAGKLSEQNLDLLEFQSLITAFGHLPARQEVSSDRVVERNRDKEINKRRLAEVCARAPEIGTAINEAADSMNGNPANPRSFDELHELIKAQAFRLANWRVASDDINYRRFFDINDLAALCMENETVFEATHRLILKFVADGKVDGLRIDHPDGLYDPAQYFERLRDGIAAVLNNSEDKSRYTVIEKILTGSERLPSQWPVGGTTGYDFSNLVNGLFVDRAGVTRFERIYRNFIGEETDLDDLSYRCRRLVMRVALASELNVLAVQLSRIALSKRHTCDFTLNSLREALAKVVASFPVYRTYISSSISSGGVSENDEYYIRTAIGAAKWRSPAADPSVFDFIREVLLTRIADRNDAIYRSTVAAFAMKFQQFTGPVMAKGMEDTAFYRYQRLISLNDVGGDLHRFGISTAEFHAANQERLRDWPHTMLATSTHDSKRSEDVRARINVLSEIPGLWRLRARDWQRFNRSHRSVIDGKPAPSSNDEYALYQTLVGAWPSAPMNDPNDRKAFGERIRSYMLKAIRESKQNTSWINPNTAYENAVSSFVNALLTADVKNRFLNDFVPFQRQVARAGLWNGLSQILLKLTTPGVPDIYQGNDVWDFSLVDPDNRRPVDYNHRQQLFESLRRWGGTPDAAAVRSLLENPEDGRLKLYLIWKTLCLRKEWPDVFERGEYLPLNVQGARADHVVAFLRKNEQASVLVAVPRLVAGLLGDSGGPPTGSNIWEDTHVLLPAGSPETYRNAFTGAVKMLASGDAKIAVAELLADFPVALAFANAREQLSL
jgi:(1->4)-alpha-D-glucan 1-alpha-D-glucosylmutase